MLASIESVTFDLNRKSCGELIQILVVSHRDGFPESGIETSVEVVLPLNHGLLVRVELRKTGIDIHKLKAPRVIAVENESVYYEDHS